MFPNFIGVNEKFLNLSSVALIEDRSGDDQSVAVIVTSDGQEIELIGSDADIVFERVELFSQATDKLIATLQTGGPQQ